MFEILKRKGGRMKIKNISLFEIFFKFYTRQQKLQACLSDAEENPRFNVPVDEQVYFQLCSRYFNTKNKI